MGGQALLLSSGKVNKAAHRVQKTLGDGKAEAEAAGEAAASGIRLIKDVVHLCQLGACHADAGIPYIHDQVDSVFFPPVIYPDVYAALLRKFNGVFHQDFQHMRNLLHVPNEDRRRLWINVKHQLQMLPAALQGGHCDDVVQHRGNHILFFSWG